LRSYLNGTLVATTMFPTATSRLPSKTTNAVRIGRGYQNLNLRGMVDEVRIYSSVLSASNILQLVQPPQAGRQASVESASSKTTTPSIVYVNASYKGAEKGTQKQPFNTIQEGVDAARSGGTVVVLAGKYTGDATISGKSGLALTGQGGGATVLAGAIAISGSDAISIRGFDVTGAGIHATSATLTVERNTFRGANSGGRYEDCRVAILGNDFTDCARGPVILLDATGSMARVQDNIFTRCGEPLMVYGVAPDAMAQVFNNVFFGSGTVGIGLSDKGGYAYVLNNTAVLPAGISNGVAAAFLIQGAGPAYFANNICVGSGSSSLAVAGAANVVVEYNCDYGLAAEPYFECTIGAGNFVAEPLLVNPAGDWHLKPGSPCIDAGNPDALFNDVDETRNDMGAYGGNL
jgi:hypothetical protein